MALVIGGESTANLVPLANYSFDPEQPGEIWSTFESHQRPGLYLLFAVHRLGVRAALRVIGSVSLAFLRRIRRSTDIDGSHWITASGYGCDRSAAAQVG